MGRANHISHVLAAAWAPFLGPHAAWERAAQVGGPLDTGLIQGMGDLREAFLGVLYTVQAIREGRGHALRLPWCELERASHAGILALLDAGYTFPLDQP